MADPQPRTYRVRLIQGERRELSRDRWMMALRASWVGLGQLPRDGQALLMGADAPGHIPGVEGQDDGRST